MPNWFQKEDLLRMRSETLSPRYPASCSAARADLLGTLTKITHRFLGRGIILATLMNFCPFSRLSKWVTAYDNWLLPYAPLPPRRRFRLACRRHRRGGRVCAGLGRLVLGRASHPVRSDGVGAPRGRSRHNSSTITDIRP